MPLSYLCAIKLTQPEFDPIEEARVGIRSHATRKRKMSDYRAINSNSFSLCSSEGITYGIDVNSKYLKRSEKGLAQMDGKKLLLSRTSGGEF